MGHVASFWRRPYRTWALFCLPSAEALGYSTSPLRGCVPSKPTQPRRIPRQDRFSIYDSVSYFVMFGLSRCQQFENPKSQIVNPVISNCYTLPIPCHPVFMESSSKKPRCQFISKIGARCQADPQTGKDYCFFHDPDQKKKQA